MLLAINWRYWPAGKNSSMRMQVQGRLMKARFIEIHQVYAKKKEKFEYFSDRPHIQPRPNVFFWSINIPRIKLEKLEFQSPCWNNASAKCKIQFKEIMELFLPLIDVLQAQD